MSQEGRNASLGTLIFNLSPSVKSLIRKVEKINEKVISAYQGILFNEYIYKPSKTFEMKPTSCQRKSIQYRKLNAMLADSSEFTNSFYL